MTGLFGSGPSREVIRILEGVGFEAVFVGGAVRDHVLQREATDIDIATSAEPLEVKELFPITVDLGTEHGTVLVLKDGEPIEVTTFRTEGTYSDHRRPDSVQFVKSLKEDLIRRDFTMNALAMTRDGKLIDLFDGVEDMNRQLIRAVGNASDRFKEDALRMIRAIRFTSVLGYDIEDATCKAITDNAQQIRLVSVERLKAEMDKLFSGVHPEKAIRYLHESGLATHLPLFPDDKEKLGRLAPFSTSSEGWACMMIAGDFPASSMANSYKLSNAEKSFLTSIHDAFENRLKHSFSADDYYKYDLDVLVTTEKIFRSLCLSEQTLTAEQIKKNKLALPIHSKSDLHVSGSDLIKWMNIKGGKWIGEWIGKIEHAVLHGQCENDPRKIKEWFLHEFNREK
ncbi:CCA tRNA nucleotidyltransferase [Filibacter tadaridae]|uniref:CCA-adding enzyme n=1 Tax=Filibacter tadaridae TaxID=2483811 RepID=A0A3P5XE97_9BACL|nr:CCA tRNA nucleotidyltransferase [Filibacter tadaridae]VDC29165.1 CCA-adding enzyme [Filibacter tadaridae]